MVLVVVETLVHDCLERKYAILKGFGIFMKLSCIFNYRLYYDCAKLVTSFQAYLSLLFK